jgi:hypothetical protein
VCGGCLEKLGHGPRLRAHNKHARSETSKVGKEAKAVFVSDFPSQFWSAHPSKPRLTTLAKGLDSPSRKLRSATLRTELAGSAGCRESGLSGAREAYGSNPLRW